MSVYNYLKLQPVDPQEDGTVSTLDQFQEDETFNLDEESESIDIVTAWENLEHDMHETSNKK